MNGVFPKAFISRPLFHNVSLMFSLNFATLYYCSFKFSLVSSGISFLDWVFCIAAMAGFPVCGGGSAHVDNRHTFNLKLATNAFQAHVLFDPDGIRRSFKQQVSSTKEVRFSGHSQAQCVGGPCRLS